MFKLMMKVTIIIQMIKQVSVLENIKEEAPKCLEQVELM